MRKVTVVMTVICSYLLNNATHYRERKDWLGDHNAQQHITPSIPLQRTGDHQQQ